MNGLIGIDFGLSGSSEVTIHFFFLSEGEYDSTRTRRVGIMDMEKERRTCNPWKVFLTSGKPLAVALAQALDNSFGVRMQLFGENFRK